MCFASGGVIVKSGWCCLFLSFIDAEVEFPEHEAGFSGCVQALNLVVPDNAYNERVPLAIGTNAKTVSKSVEKLVFCKGLMP